ncbi:hypothetical protein BN971_02180 [Mycobacterium bohemicum DSM 44277]|uniref:Uncharacterized protein n=1 Tax=Mycobacterium bohemicum DSM 44277 TaxID=1236609 RepID=A0A0U0W9W0_MYCBE|nr:hypothetical protein BN971_02180 [Mycobacterium bohemicum DSM 44277]
MPFERRAQERAGARNGARTRRLTSSVVPPYPEEPDYYSEPTQAARYGGYYDQAPEPPEPRQPWYRRPAALVAAGAVGVIVLAAVAFAVVKLVSGSPGHAPAATTTTTAPTTTTVATTTTTEAPRHHGGGGGGEPTQTVTETVPPPSTDTGTTTVPPTTDTGTTTVPPTTDTSTVTQTVTVPPRRPFQPFQPRP